MTDSPLIMPMTSSDLSVENHDSGEKDAMEERLRMLVLQSQRSKLKAGAPSSRPSQSNGIASSSSSNSSTDAMTPAPAGFSLDDLAVSFIQETIETYKTSPQISPAVQAPVSKPKPSSQVNSTTRLELAAKQRRLEQEIAETKTLMAKLAQARTKHEKDGILAEMREKSRCVSSHLLAVCSLAIMNRLSIWIFHCGFSYRTTGEDASNPTVTQAASEQPSVKLPTAQTCINWPKSHRDAGVLIVSDDEDGSDSDGDEDGLN